MDSFTISIFISFIHCADGGERMSHYEVTESQQYQLFILLLTSMQTIIAELLFFKTGTNSA